MRNRPTTLFRGSELPRLLFLVAIVLAGWPMCLMFAHSDEPEKPAPPAIPVAKITPVEPLQGIEFQAIEDRKEILPRETAAYAKLLQMARDTPADVLAQEARRDIFFTHLWERPEKYRGVPIHLTGVAKKILTYEVAPTMSPAERLYDVWFYSDENRAFPYVLVIQDPPVGLTIGHELNLRITVDGYFFKLMKYRAEDTYRAAPLLVGRMHWTPAPPPAPSLLTELKQIPRRDLAIGVFVLFLVYLTFRMILQFRKARALSSPRSAMKLSGDEGLPPDQLANWLENLPGDTDDEPHEPSDRP